MRALVGLLLVTVLAGCGAGEAPGVASSATQPRTVGATTSGEPGGDRFPDVVDVELTPTGAERTYDVAATLSSPYDSPERYADAFRVRTESGDVLGVRELTHDHAAEQPFTRTLAGVVVPTGVDEVVVEGRDQANGLGGQALLVPVP